MKKPLIRNLILCIAQVFTAVFALSSVFLASPLTDDVAQERNSEYITSVVKNKTAHGDYCALAIDAPNKGPTFYAGELENLFDIIKGGVTTYGSAMNVDKSKPIYFKNIETSCLSFFYIGPIGSSSWADSNGVKHFRHYKYNFNTLFEDAVFKGSEYDIHHIPVAYISKTQAYKILEYKNVVKLGTDDYTIEQYESLIFEEIDFESNGEPCKFVVWNIFETDNFYAKAFEHIMGDYIITSYDYPENCNLRSNHKSLYFFNEYSYYNRYLMKYLNTKFQDNKPTANIVKYNLKQEIDENRFLNFYSIEPTKSNQTLFIIVVIISAVLLIASIMLVFISSRLLHRKSLLTLGLIPLFIPYLVFKLIYSISMDSLFFSKSSCAINAIFLIVYILVFIYLMFIRRQGGRVKFDNYYEIVI